jgi:hypothetical protein
LCLSAVADEEHGASLHQNVSVALGNVVLADHGLTQPGENLGVALVELLAYVGDHLSYQQDAVGTEAYLATARRRVSVRRHARMVDYFMHDGGNARAWVQVLVGEVDHAVLKRGTPLLSRLPQVSRRVAPEQMPTLLKQHPVVFETMSDAVLFAAHNEIEFYTWGNERCCLP